MRKTVSRCNLLTLDMYWPDHCLCSPQTSAKSAECVDEAFLRTAELVYQKTYNSGDVSDVTTDVTYVIPVGAHCVSRTIGVFN